MTRSRGLNPFAHSSFSTVRGWLVHVLFSDDLIGLTSESHWETALKKMDD